MKLKDVPRSKLSARGRAFVGHLISKGYGNVEVDVQGRDIQIDPTGLQEGTKEAIQNEAAAFRNANPPGEPIRSVPRETPTTAVAQAAPAPAPAQALTAGIQAAPPGAGALSPPQAYAPGSRLSQMRDVADQGALSPPAPGTSFTPGPPSPMGMAPSDFGGIATPPAGFTASDYGMQTGPAPAALAPSTALSSPGLVQGLEQGPKAPVDSLMGPGTFGPALGPQALGAVPEGGLLAPSLGLAEQAGTLQAPQIDPNQPMAPPMAPATEIAPAPPVAEVPFTPQAVEEAAPAPPAEAYPTPSLAPSDIYGGAIGTAAATGGNFVSRDPYGTTSVTNQYGATTGMTPGGYQTAYGGTPGGDIGGSLFGGGGAQGYGGFDALGNPMSGLGQGLRNLGKRAIGLDPNRSFASQKNQWTGRLLGAFGGGILAGGIGALGGGFFGGQIGARHDFPDKPSSANDRQGVPGGARTERERSDISPAASRSISRGDRVSGLW